jgi:L-aspartate oxidase
VKGGLTTAAGPTGPTSRLAVVGSGIAGLYAALLAAEAGAEVTLLSKEALERSNTHFAQGGICAVLGDGQAAPGDTVEAHIADTLKAGAGYCDPEAVRILCTQAKEDIARLERFGVVFDADSSSGIRSLGLEAAHSAARILHAGGDATGAAIADALIAEVFRAAASSGGRITLLQDAFLTGITTAAGRATGIRYLRDGAEHGLAADAVLLATGGAGQLFEHSTNPSVATADGVAAAWRAGAAVADAEFFQFHPTALAVPGNFMISEAVRGVGAVLRDGTGYRFMPDYHPDAELAPRDVVSRSIAAHLRAIGADDGATVYLDATAVEADRGAGYLAGRFPTIDATTRRLGFDWTREWLPVIPAAHYWMGGVATDLRGRTSLVGLYAAGEVACTGVHGANRLASNSLLEGLVFARRAVEDFVASDGLGGSQARTDWPRSGARILDLPATGEAPFEAAELRRLMARAAGVVRDDAGLAVAAKQLAAWGDSGSDRTSRELQNLRTAAQLLVQAARHRADSAGGHYRSDYPDRAAAPARETWVRGPGTHPIMESETR